MAPFINSDQRFFFYILTGVNPNSIQRIKATAFDIHMLRASARTFQALFKEIPLLKPILSSKSDHPGIGELELFIHLGLKKTSIVIYSNSEKNLEDFYRFLMLLQPSDIRPWLAFNVQRISYEDGTIENTLGPLSSWSVASLSDKGRPIFSLYRTDYRIVNKLLPKYFDAKEKQFFKRLLALYDNAYSEQKDYFKFLVFFMIIESLVKDDEKAGVVYKIRRMCAVLVGHDEEFCGLIYKKVSDAYNLRSQLVHSAISNVHKGEFLQLIHSITCEILIAVMLYDIPTLEEVFKIANRSGYGTKRSLISDKGPLKSYTYINRNKQNIKTISTRIK